MKRARLTKLALSGAAVAALAATFSTSTYAWYVSNKVANVNGGTGSTGEAGADGSVMLSWQNSATAVWGREINFSTSTGCPDLSSASLQPVHYDTAKSSGDVLVPALKYTQAEKDAALQRISDAGNAAEANYNPALGESDEVTAANKAAAKAAAITAAQALAENAAYNAIIGTTEKLAAQTASDDQEAGFYKLTTAGLKGSAATATDVISFTLYAKSEDATGVLVTPSIVINNTTSSVSGLAQPAIVGTSQGSPTAEGNSFFYDALDSLYVQQKTTVYKLTSDTSKQSKTYYTWNNTTKRYVAVAADATFDAATWYEAVADSISYTAASKASNKGTALAGAITAGAGNAHTYFQAVSGAERLWATTPADDGTHDLDQIYIKDTAVAITYTIFLDGADVDCFNSCAGQDISFSLKFTVVE